jgi:hypothetical protein
LVKFRVSSFDLGEGYLSRMALSVCPAATCHAPVERVWSLLADPQLYGSWSDAVVEGVLPPGPVHPGQQVLLRAPASGRLFPVRFFIEQVDPVHHVLQLLARFPLGLQLRSRISVTALDDASSRIQYG